MAGDAEKVEATGANIVRAAEILRRGGLVAFATETVYGLGANAFDAAAVAKVFEVKGRPTFDPLIVHVAKAEDARELVSDWPDAAQRLAEAFWPGPLTLVLPRRASIPDLVTSGLETVGVRVPAHAATRDLIEASATGGRPGAVAAPSANRFGAISPTTAAHVQREFAGRGDVVEMVLDGGACETGVESTVVSLAGEAAVVLRMGGVALESIREVVGEVELARPTSKVASPGMLERHYAPRTRLVLLGEGGWEKAAEGASVGFLCFRERPPGLGDSLSVVEVLSPRGDLREAAAGLFAAMRRLDESGVDVIVAERVPEEGLGRAINDRLHRASRG